ncbi:hypothetical protein L596_024502 [Steinernema carpocapsae]|uniref:Peptidase M14 domain-containing protein n=1 Tax=Steinernema carpocapsae TaxID=34508 RepID=A0A4U5MI14_STECR|nr:hypothetical protein L596_024502 [Steinernema carpocapsae]
MGLVKLINFQIGYNSTKPKNVLFINAGIHAREWVAPATALYTIRSLVTDPSYTSIQQAIVVAVSECGARNVLRLGKAATALTQTGISPSIGASRGLPETPARKTYINVTLVTFTGCLEAVYDYLEVIRAENQRA